MTNHIIYLWKGDYGLCSSSHQFFYGAYVGNLEVSSLANGNWQPIIGVEHQPSEAPKFTKWATTTNVFNHAYVITSMHEVPHTYIYYQYMHAHLDHKQQTLSINTHAIIIHHTFQS